MLLGTATGTSIADEVVVMVRTTSAVTLLAVAMTAVGCGGRVQQIQVPDAEPSATQLAELWVDPGSEPRDLFWGIGGRRFAPDPAVVYTMDERDDSGFSVTYDVTGPDKTEWSAKIGPEAQTEVVVSRILWGLGYHQPPMHYLAAWRIDRGDGPTRRESEARFRPKLPQLKRLDEYWRWADNAFLGAREFRGMLVVLLMLNSTDLKDDNNSIYELTEPWDGAGRWFVVRDVGAALGTTGKLYPRRNWVAGFEQQAFITRIDGDQVAFQYKGRHQELITMIRPDDVRWAAERMQRLTDKQWHDAFRAANYADPVTERYIARIKEKIADGLALRVDRRVAPGRTGQPATR
jgi:hypothetical protein